MPKGYDWSSTASATVVEHWLWSQADLNLVLLFLLISSMTLNNLCSLSGSVSYLQVRDDIDTSQGNCQNKLNKLKAPNT